MTLNPKFLAVLMLLIMAVYLGYQSQEIFRSVEQLPVESTVDKVTVDESRGGSIAEQHIFGNE